MQGRYLHLKVLWATCMHRSLYMPKTKTNIIGTHIHQFQYNWQHLAAKSKINPEIQNYEKKLKQTQSDIQI